MSNPAFKNLVKVSFTPTINTTAYAANDALHTDGIELVGALKKVPAAGRIAGVRVVDLADQKSELHLHFFDAEPANSTVTINAAVDFNDTELKDSHLGFVSVAAGDYESLADNAVASVEAALPIVLDEGARSIFVVVVSGGTPTYASTSDIKIDVFIEQD